MRNHVLGLATAFCLGLSIPCNAGTVAEGERLLADNCGRCHAIGKEDDSPLPIAPPFRRVLKIYDASALEEALAEGLITGHPDMPEFVFPPEQVGSIISYLHTLEEAP